MDLFVKKKKHTIAWNDSETWVGGDFSFNFRVNGLREIYIINPSGRLVDRRFLSFQFLSFSSGPRWNGNGNIFVRTIIKTTMPNNCSWYGGLGYTRDGRRFSLAKHRLYNSRTHMSLHDQRGFIPSRRASSSFDDFYLILLLLLLLFSSFLICESPLAYLLVRQIFSIQHNCIPNLLKSCTAHRCTLVTRDETKCFSPIYVSARRWTSYGSTAYEYLLRMREYRNS